MYNLQDCVNLAAFGKNLMKIGPEKIFCRKAEG